MSLFHSTTWLQRVAVCGLSAQKSMLDCPRDAAALVSRTHAPTRALAFCHTCFGILPRHCVTFCIRSHNTHGAAHRASSLIGAGVLCCWCAVASESSASRKRPCRHVLSLKSVCIAGHDTRGPPGQTCLRSAAASTRSTDTVVGCPTLSCAVLFDNGVATVRRSTNEAVSCLSHVEHLR